MLRQKKHISHISAYFTNPATFKMVVFYFTDRLFPTRMKFVELFHKEEKVFYFIAWEILKQRQNEFFCVKWDLNFVTETLGDIQNHTYFGGFSSNLWWNERLIHLICILNTFLPFLKLLLWLIIWFYCWTAALKHFPE